MPDPAVVVAMRDFKTGLLAQEAVQMQEMAARWVIIERRLEADILALAEEVAAMRQAGQAVNVGKLYRLDRYKKLLVQTNNEMLGYVKYLDGRIAEAQARMAQLGISNAAQAIRYAAWPQVIQTFDVLPISAVEYMVGNAANGAPLGELLKQRMIRDAEGNVLPGVWDRLTTTLINGTGLGWNPRKTARVMRDDLAQGLDKALVIARTEQLRVYRESSRAQYQESGVVEGQRRLAAHDDRTCAACLMADGEILGLNETMYDHAQGRCSTVPIVAGVPPPEWESGEDWFKGQSSDTQRKILGKGRHSAWLAGGFNLRDVVHVTEDETWGKGLAVKPLKDLVQ